MTKRLLLSFLFFVVWFAVKAQSTTLVPHSFAAGNASVANYNEWVSFHTPASLASEDGISLQLLAENRYFSKELFNEAASFAIHTKPLNIGASFAHFGYEGYHEMIAGVAFARSFIKDRLLIGIQANYYTIYLSQLDKYKGTVFAQVGIQGEVARNFYIGFHAFNPTFSKIKSTAIVQKIPSVFSLGTKHIINEKVNWTAQLDKEIQGRFRWALGVEYMPVEQLSLRLGGYGLTFVPTLGVGLKFGEFRFNLQCEYHQKLGLCTLGFVSYRFK